MDGLYVQRTDGPCSWWKEEQRIAAALFVCERTLIKFFSYYEMIAGCTFYEWGLEKVFKVSSRFGWWASEIMLGGIEQNEGGMSVF